MSTMSPVEFDLEKLSAIRDCTKLMSLLQHYISRSQMTEAVSLWARRPDSCFQAVWGSYVGYDSIERCFLRDFGDRRDPGDQEALKGYVCMQGVNSERLCIAGDLQTARGLWRSMGVDACGKVVRRKQDVGRAFWTMSKYGVDFLRDNGQWKIWHILMASVLHCPYDTKWGACESYGGFPLRATTEDLPPALPVYDYSLDSHYDHDRPEVPEEYACFAEIAPGYAYIFKKEAIE